VTFVGRIDDAQLLEHYAKCRAVVFPTFDEDYGFVTVEAFSSGKAVITCHDSGGPAELVRNDESGLVVDPSAAGLAKAIVAVMDDRTLATRLGEAGSRQAARMSWTEAVKRLVL
jgi:glycosyltransferase involved in cell wall biosynthesis